MAEPGDLLLIFGDSISRTWKQIIYFNRPKQKAEDEQEAYPAAPAPSQIITEEHEADPLGEATPVQDAPAVPESVTLGGMRMVRDERGVRLAVDEESD